MYHRIILSAFLLATLLIDGLSAKERITAVWPSTLESVQGKWYAERSEAAIEITGNQVFLRRSSVSAKQLYSGISIGGVIATLNNDFAPDINRYSSTPSYTRFTGLCNERGSSRQCPGFVNYPIDSLKESPKRVVKMSITIGDSDRFYRYDDLAPEEKAKHQPPL